MVTADEGFDALLGKAACWRIEFPSRKIASHYDGRGRLSLSARSSALSAKLAGAGSDARQPAMRTPRRR